jgi:hypothetical protein
VFNPHPQSGVGGLNVINFRKSPKVSIWSAKTNGDLIRKVARAKVPKKQLKPKLQSVIL